MLDKFKICQDMDLCLRQLNQNSKLAVAISREYTHNNRLNSDQTFYCFESDIIFEYSLEFQIRKNFPYLAELNKFIEIACAGGLIEKWRSNHYIRGYKQEEKNVPFSLEEMSGFLLIFPLIVVIIFITLFLERITYRKVRTPNTSRFWLIVEKIIDPERDFSYENKWI